MWAIFLKTLPDPETPIILGFSFYVYFGGAVTLFTRKTRTDNPWLASVEVGNPLLLCRIDCRPGWLILLFLISFSKRRRYCAFRSRCPEENWLADLAGALLRLGRRSEVRAEPQQVIPTRIERPEGLSRMGDNVVRKCGGPS